MGSDWSADPLYGELSTPTRARGEDSSGRAVLRADASEPLPVSKPSTPT